MQSKERTSMPRTYTIRGLEVRYERTFLLDVRNLDRTMVKQVQQFVFDDFFKISQLQELPEFRQIGSSEIFYRFTLGRYLVSLEITGHIIKFLRLLPKPEV